MCVHATVLLVAPDRKGGPICDYKLQQTIRLTLPSKFSKILMRTQWNVWHWCALWLSLFIRNSDICCNVGWVDHIRGVKTFPKSWLQSLYKLIRPFEPAEGTPKLFYQFDLLHNQLTYQEMKLMLVCCFATKMEDNNEQSHPERTITPPKHLSSSVWKYFGFCTADGKVTNKDFVKSSCLTLQWQQI